MRIKYQLILLLFLFVIIISCEDKITYFNEAIPIKDFPKYHEYMKLPIKFSSWTVDGNSNFIFLTKNSIKIFNSLSKSFKEEKIPWNLEYASIDTIKVKLVDNKLYAIYQLKLLVIDLDKREKKEIDLEKILPNNILFCGRHIYPFFYYSILKYNSALYDEICDVYQKKENIKIIRIDNFNISIDNDILQKLKIKFIREKLKNLAEFNPDISILAVSKKYLLILIDNKNYYYIIKLTKKELKIKQKMKIFKEDKNIKFLISKKFEYDKGKLYYLYYYTENEVKFKIYNIRI